MIFRLFTEKKRGLDSEAHCILALIKQNIDLDNDVDIRIFTRYDIEGLDSESIDRVKRIACDSADTAFADYLPLTSEWTYFAITRLSGQFDHTAEDLRQTLRVCGITEELTIHCATIIALSNVINLAKIEEIKKILVDPKAAEIVTNTKPLSLEEKAEPPIKASVIEDFGSKNDYEIQQLCQALGIEKPYDALYKLRDLCKAKGVNPTDVQLYAIHSFVKAKSPSLTQTKINGIEISESPLNVPVKIALDEYLTARRELGRERNRPVSLDDIAFIGINVLKKQGLISDIEQTPEGNRIDLFPDVDGVTEQWMLSFKNTGGNPNDFVYFDDALAAHLASRAVPFQSVVVNNAPMPEDPDEQTDLSKPLSQIPLKTFHDNRIKAEYNRRAGLPVGQCEIVFGGNTDRQIQFSASAAAVSKGNITRSAPAPGDSLIILGGRIRQTDCALPGKLQILNPEVQKQIRRLVTAPDIALLIKKSCDFHLSVCGGLASLDLPMDIHLDQVIKTQSCSIGRALYTRSQRVAIIVDKASEVKIKEMAHKLNLKAHVAGTVTDENCLRFYLDKKEYFTLQFDLMNRLYSPISTNVFIAAPANPLGIAPALPAELKELPVGEAFLKNLKRPDVAFKKSFSMQYDHSQQANAVLAPFGGKYQLTPEEACVQKIPAPFGKTTTTTVISFGCVPDITARSPFHGAAFAVMESLSKIVAVGANTLDAKLSFSQYCKQPETMPSRWGNPVCAMLGAFAAQTGMGIPAVENNCMTDVSDDFASPYAFAAFALGVSKVNDVISAAFKHADSTILFIPMPTVAKTGLPDFDRAKVLYRQLHYLSHSSKILSAGVVKSGGIAATVAKMSFGNGLGVRFDISDKNLLFTDFRASIIVETADPGAFSGMNTVIIGKTTKENNFVFPGCIISMADALSNWNARYEKTYPANNPGKTPMANVPYCKKRITLKPDGKFAKPNVLIPVFPFADGEESCAGAFDKAGGNCNVLYFNTKYQGESVKHLCKAINNAQILMLQSGEESVRYMTAVLNSMQVREAVSKLLLRRGLILGIGGGFAALLQCGLLPNGSFSAPTDSSPCIAPNASGKYVSQLVTTRVTSVASPWMAYCEPGELHTLPASHLYGRFIADEAAVAALIKNGQIATQYVDKTDKPTGKTPFNPNGSVCAIEGISSPDGRVLGKMTLPQRRTSRCYINVPGNKDTRIFAAGIDYFK